jgi:hypothetical protein
MAKVQAVGSETVNAYDAQGLPASFELVVNGRNGTVALVKFNICDVNGNKLYVSGVVNSQDVCLVETALTHAGLKNQRCSRKFERSSVDIITLWLSEHPIDRGKISFPNQSEEYCEKVVDFVRGQQRVA